MLDPLAIERLRWHQQQGHRVIVLSASPKIYLRPWAAQFEVAEIVATTLELDRGIATGRIAGQNCHGAEKVRRLTEHLGELKAWRIHAYADARSDRFLLEVADDAHYRTFSTWHGRRGRLHALGCLLKALK